MVLTVFRSRLRPEANDYPDLAARMSELAKRMPGYIAHKSFTAEDGERVTLVEFESEEAQRAWRVHPEHVEAQRKGRQAFYSEYRLQICSVQRETSFPPRAK
jgi:heme-degrading monooxygenase HmoA